MARIGITMGCPVGIGPEIILKYFKNLAGQNNGGPVVIGDIGVLRWTAAQLGIDIQCHPWQTDNPLPANGIPVYSVSELDVESLKWGAPTTQTGKAMAQYIFTAMKLVSQGMLNGITTGPISKVALQKSGYNYPGHTEMLGELSGIKDFGMMMAGNSLRVTLVTIHCSFKDIVSILTIEKVYECIKTTHTSLQKDFGINQPRIGVAGLNPHAGEDGLFGNEEHEIITPAIKRSQSEKIDAVGPLPPDTAFFQAAQGKYDAVVCMYHDQGLIPFKLLHFHDGVNVTIGLPVVRTSVDHGTAYDIAGTGKANPESLTEAVKLAEIISANRTKKLAQDPDE
ncbi:MAG: 4-hydroxythreonine-4-phosphate dehydrogenase PdxA [Desulfocapsaceae bacterium]|nr:4-hydroxythreonine-4-phosphate dehydrogenase PdxA [Desulfocapsaceae bacterium]